MVAGRWALRDRNEMAAIIDSRECKSSAYNPLNNLKKPLDLLQMAVSGLKPGQMYRLWLTTSQTPPYGQKQELATFKTNLAGAQIVQTVGPFRQVLTFESEKSAEVPRQRFLLVTAADSGTPEVIERVP